MSNSLPKRIRKGDIFQTLQFWLAEVLFSVVWGRKSSNTKALVALPREAVTAPAAARPPRLSAGLGSTQGAVLQQALKAGFRPSFTSH